MTEKVTLLSELIPHLQTILAEYGDLPVYVAETEQEEPATIFDIADSHPERSFPFYAPARPQRLIIG